MNFILFDELNIKQQLLPLTFTKPIAYIKWGIITIKEKWDLMLNTSTSVLTDSYMQTMFRLNTSEKSIYVNAAIVPNEELINEITMLKPNCGIKNGTRLIAFYSVQSQFDYQHAIQLCTETNISFLQIKHVVDIFSHNGKCIESDFELITKNKTSAPLSNTNILIGSSSKLFIEEGAIIEASILNTTQGAIYIGKNAEIMEGSTVRGPFALGNNAVLKMQTKIYGGTSIGTNCKVGGEINNSVFFDNSNKAHDGFIGNSVIGSWCNLGANANNSNLKNNYKNVKLYNYTSQKNEDTQLQFCGLIMGDYCKVGINAMFNTGTVIGVGVNVYDTNFLPNFIPSFSFGNSKQLEVYQFDKFIETIDLTYQRRDLKLTKAEIDILQHLYNTK